jgi:ferredoxin-type protein NapF
MSPAEPSVSRRRLLTGSTRPSSPPALVAVIGETCLARAGIVCQTCRDACPVGAIRFRPTLRGVATPTVLPDACTGCGECVSSCPTAAVRVRDGETADVG